ncbi:MAG: hypothetical protein ACWA41_12075 [Putridiphycobacter sp.]
MKTAFFTLAFLFGLPHLQAQTNGFNLGGIPYKIETEVVQNEWNTQDTLQKIYRMGGSAKVYQITYYKYKDEGGDCNNLFWQTSTIQVKADSLIILTHFHQKTGIDPIPEWQKQIFVMNAAGQLTQVYSRFKYYHQNEWVKA